MNEEQVSTSYSIDPALSLEYVARAIEDFLACKFGEAARVGSQGSELDKTRRIFRIDYSKAIFDEGNVYQWLNLLLLLSSVRGTRLEEVNPTRDMCEVLKGPRFGLDGILRSLGLVRNSGHLLCYMLDVRAAQEPQALSRMAYEATLGGANLIFDDELLHDQGFCRLEARVSCVADGLDRAQQETGLRYLYAANISSGYPELMERAEVALENGASCLMLCGVLPPVSEIRALANDLTLNAPIYAHGPNPLEIVLSRGVISLFMRLAGADLVLAGGEGALESSALEKLRKPLECAPSALPSVPVISGLKNPSSIKKLVAELGGGVAFLMERSAVATPLGSLRNYVQTYSRMASV